MPGDKLTYFKELRARGEAARMLLAMSGKPFERDDVPVADWPARKPGIPIGTLPALYTEDGKYLGQSEAICRYLAKKHGLIGKDLWEEAKNDYVMGNVTDAIGSIYPHVSWLVFGKTERPDDAEQKIAAIREKWTKLAALIAEDAKDSKFVLSDEIQVADVYLYTSMESSTVAVPDLLSINPWIKDWVARFTSDERVKAYLDTRPKDCPI